MKIPNFKDENEAKAYGQVHYKQKEAIDALNLKYEEVRIDIATSKGALLLVSMALNAARLGKRAVVLICMMLILPISAYAQDTNWSTWLPDTDIKVERLANAIFWAEGGHNTNYPYGIKSVRCKNGENGGCREVCKRTIFNNIKRFKRWNRNKRRENGFSYLKFLQSRYCPTTGNLSKAEERLNGNWLRLVKQLYDQNKGRK